MKFQNKYTAVINSILMRSVRFFSPKKVTEMTLTLHTNPEYKMQTEQMHLLLLCQQHVLS